MPRKRKVYRIIYSDKGERLGHFFYKTFTNKKKALAKAKELEKFHDKVHVGWMYK